MKNVLVTGHKGFIGSNLTRKLKTLDCNLFTLPSKIDLKTSSDIYNFIAGLPPLDYLFNLADLNGNSYWLKANQASAFAVNTYILSFLTSAIVELHSNCKIIFTGSVWALPANKRVVYEGDFGSSGFLTALESYAKSKIYGLDLLRFYNKQCNTSFTYFILPSIFGPGDSSDHLIPTLIEELVRKHQSSYHLKTDGSEQRSYLHIDDVVDALWLMRDAKVEVLNLSSPLRYSVSNVVDMIVSRCTASPNVSLGQIKAASTPELASQLSESLYQWPSCCRLKSLQEFLDSACE